MLTQQRELEVYQDAEKRDSSQPAPPSDSEDFVAGEAHRELKNRVVDTTPIEDTSTVVETAKPVAPPDGGLVAWLQTSLPAHSSMLGTCAFSFGVVFGHMVLSLVHEYWQAMLAQGFVVDLGVGCLFMPSIALTPQYFSTRIGAAMGLSVAGSSLGGVIYPIMFSNLVRVNGFRALALLVIPLLTMKIRVKPPAKRSLFDRTVLTDKPFIAFVLACFVGYIGLLIPLFYFPVTSIVKGFSSADFAFYLLPLLDAYSFPGRVVLSIVSDKFGQLNILIPTAAITAILAFCILAMHSLAGIVVMSIFYGFWSGAYISMPSTIVVKLTPSDNLFLIGTRMGMAMTIMGLGILIGNPVASVIAGSQNNFTGVYAFGGATLAVASLGFCVVRYLRGGLVLKVKV